MFTLYPTLYVLVTPDREGQRVFVKFETGDTGEVLAGDLSITEQINVASR